MDNRPERRYVFGLHGQPWYWFGKSNRGENHAHRHFDRPIKFESTGDIDFEQMVDHENLIATFHLLDAQGGDAPGPDGVTFRDLGRQEQAAAMRQVHTALIDGSWRPGKPRRVRVPKPAGGTRTLKMRNIVDRVVSKAVTEAIMPPLDELMMDCSKGFRPGRSHLSMLAELAAIVETEDAWVVVEDDLNKAFDVVPVAPTVELFRNHIPDTRTADLVETILRGHQGARRQVGLDQGDPLSPLGMNLLLTNVLDRPITSACPHTPFLRFADNLVWLGKNVSEGRHAMNEASHILEQPGFRLKGNQPLNLLRQGTGVQILGFRLQRENHRVVFTIGDSGWECLTRNLAEAHDRHHPAMTAKLICEGWLCACGPAFENAAHDCAILDRVRRTASRMGFREIGNTDRLLWVIQETRDRWVLLREQTQVQLQKRQILCSSSVRESAACPRARIDHPSESGTVAGSAWDVTMASG